MADCCVLNIYFDTDSLDWHLACAAVLGIAAVVSQQQPGGTEAGTSKVKRANVPRKNAVLVFGATGRTGQLIVKTLLDSGRTVIAACRSPKTASKAWKALGVAEGEQARGGGILFTESGVDITDPKTLKPGIFAGATQACPRRRGGCCC